MPAPGAKRLGRIRHPLNVPLGLTRSRTPFASPTTSAVTRPTSSSVLFRASVRPKRAGQAHQDHALGRARLEGTVRAARDAENRDRGLVGPGQGQDAARDLAVERGRIDVALAGDDQVGSCHSLGQAREVGDEFESLLHPCAEGEQAAGQATGSARAGQGRDVDPGLTAISRRQVHQALGERADLRLRRTLLLPEDPCRIGERGRDVAGHDDVDAGPRRR